MKGDIVHLTRIIVFRLALAAFLLSLVALSIYWAGNLQELSDQALFIAMNWAEAASITGLGLACLSFLAALFAPLFSDRISPLTILGSLVIIAGNLVVLALASTLKVIAGGLTL